MPMHKNGSLLRLIGLCAIATAMKNSISATTWQGNKPECLTRCEHAQLGRLRYHGSAMPRLFIAMLSALLAAPAYAQQNHPHKPIRHIVPFPAGGIADVIARIIGGRLTDALGQPVVEEIRAGAGGSIGAEFTAKARTCGYAILMHSLGSQAVYASL